MRDAPAEDLADVHNLQLSRERYSIQEIIRLPTPAERLPRQPAVTTFAERAMIV